MRSAIDVIAEKNEPVQRLERQTIHEACQFIEATVDVSDHKAAHGVDGKRSRSRLQAGSGDTVKIELLSGIGYGEPIL